jgi:hypothetical protein
LFTRPYLGPPFTVHPVVLRRHPFGDLVIHEAHVVLLYIIVLAK